MLQGQPRNTGRVFIKQEIKGSDSRIVTPRAGHKTPPVTVQLPLQIGEVDPEARFFGLFFADFLQANDFTGRGGMDTRDLAELSKTSPLLYRGVIAIAALDASQRCSGSIAVGATAGPKTIALHAYRDAVTALRGLLSDPRILHDDTVLWGTFILGVFEVGFLLDPII